MLTEVHSLVAIPRDFKVKLVPRYDESVIQEVMAAAAERTKDYYTEES